MAGERRAHRPSAAGWTRDGIAVASVLLIALSIAAYVYYAMGQVRQLLPREVLEQQRDISTISHSLGALVHALDHARAGSDSLAEARAALAQTLALLGSVRQEYTFDSLDGASAAHAIANPAVQDIDRWLEEGVSGFAASSRVVLDLALLRARETRDEVLALEARSDARALSLLVAEAERLDRLRLSLIALVLAFAVLAVGVVALYVRQRNAREHLVTTHRRLTDSLESVDQAVALFDGDERLVISNNRYRELYALPSPGTAPAPALLDVVEAAVASGRIASVDERTEDLVQTFRDRHAQPGRAFEMQWQDGRHFQVREHRTQEGGTVCFLTDITDLKAAQRRLEHLATHDALTGLPGRRQYESGLEAALQRADRHGLQVAVVFVDVDRLKWINDTYGHLAGDRFLREFGVRLRRSLRSHDLVARLGGDEFAVVLTDLEDWQQVASSVERTLEILSQPVRFGSVQFQTTVSMGIAMFPADGEDAQSLTKKADDACYHVKAGGRATYQFYTEQINQRAERRTTVEHRLRAALQTGRLEVHYQPQVALPERRTVGLEALLRWADAELGTVDPAEFVPVAEDSGLGGLLLRAATGQACEQLRAWGEQGVDPGRIWINVSPRQLLEAGAVIDSECQRHGVSPRQLGIEITERTLVDDPTRARLVLADIKARGVSLAIDDFGVGYSSLGALRDYPLDELKLDASFVRNLVYGAGGHDVEIVRAIVALARSLELGVVAEGVETEEQLEALQAEKVSVLQGNLVGEPMPGPAVERFLAGSGAG